jgi:enamine deaminase RidA (YjgF/YER057c/UK114 family)
MAVRALEPKNFPYFDYKRYAFSLGTEGKSFVFTSGQTSSEYDDSIGKMVCRGDLAQQARTAHEKLKLILDTANSDFSDAVQIVDYVSPEAGNPAPLLQVHREYFGDTIPTLSVIHVSRLLRPDALVEIELVAIKGKERNKEIGRINSSGKIAHAVQKNGLVFVASQVSVEQDSDKFEGDDDPFAQVTRIRRNIEDLIGDFGGKPDDVVKATQYVTRECLNKVAGAEEIGTRLLLNRDLPTSLVVVKKLSHPKALVEIEVVADITGKKRVFPREGSNDYGPLTVTGQGLVFLPLIWSADRTNANPSLNSSNSMAKILERVKAGANFLHLDLADIAKTRDFLTNDIEHQYRETAQIRRQFFKDKLPASSGVIIEAVWPDNPPLSMESIAIKN